MIAECVGRRASDRQISRQSAVSAGSWRACSGDCLWHLHGCLASLHLQPGRCGGHHDNCCCHGQLHCGKRDFGSVRRAGCVDLGNLDGSIRDAPYQSQCPAASTNCLVSGTPLPSPLFPPAIPPLPPPSPLPPTLHDVQFPLTNSADKTCVTREFLYQFNRSKQLYTMAVPALPIDHGQEQKPIPLTPFPHGSCKAVKCWNCCYAPPDDLFSPCQAQLPARPLVTCVDNPAAATAAHISRGLHTQVLLSDQAISSLPWFAAQVQDPCQ